MNAAHQDPLANRIVKATQSVFGDSSISRRLITACDRFELEVRNITEARGIHGLLLAIVGAKGQGKTWVARQLVRDANVRNQLRSGDLTDDATTQLVWIGPKAPEQIDFENESYLRCDAADLFDVGCPYTLVDTPGSTDANAAAAKVAAEALSLAPVKLLVIARDQMRSAASLMIAERIDGSECIPIISSVEPDELNSESQAGQQLQIDLRTLRTQFAALASRVRLANPILVPDFEISGDEESSASVLRHELKQRLSQLRLAELAAQSSRDERLSGAEDRLRKCVAKIIAEEVPQLSSAVDRLHQEASNLPEHVLHSMLGTSQVLETGVRMRLRAQLVADTHLMWFPYRTLMSTLNLTQGAWDRVILALSGSVPSIFGALTSWARNIRQSREFNLEVQDGLRQRMRRQVEERLKPLCDQFHRALTRLRSDSSAGSGLREPTTGMSLSGIEELQHRSRGVFEETVARYATRSWVAQLLAVIGVVLFWSFMSGPIVAIYRQYFAASLHALSNLQSSAEEFPHPSPSLILTSVILSLLPLLIYCMLVLTLSLSRRKVQAATTEIIQEHKVVIEDLLAKRIIQLQFEDRLLQDAEFLLTLSRGSKNS